MSTPSSTITRMVRWSVRDLASSLYSCRFPMDFSDEEHEPDKLCTSSGAVIFNRKGDGRIPKSREKASKENKNRGKKVKNSAEKVVSDESKWPSFTNEDYIVFCFKDDGGINLEERKWPIPDQVDRMEPRQINPKLIFGENSEVFQFSYENKVEEIDYIVSDSEGEEKESIHPYTELPPDDDNEDDIKDITEVEEILEPKPGPARLSDSCRSDSSSSSFAFPVMNWEWKGSPARMPKFEERSKMRKTGARIPCWRF